jgi:hypothetical protein
MCSSGAAGETPVCGQPAAESKRVSSQTRLTSLNANGSKLMPEIAISDEMYARLKEFRQVVEAVIDEEIGLDSCLELVLTQGLDSILVDLLSPLEPTILLKSFQQLASEHPAEVYQYVAETMRQGVIVQQQENMRRRLGFSTPPKAHNSGSQD